MSNKQDVSRVIARLSAAFPNWNVNEYTIQVYCEDLADIPADELEAAARICRMEEGRAFAPTIGELRAAWKQVVDKKPKPLELPPVSTEEDVRTPMPDWVRERLSFLAKSKSTKGVKHASN